MIAKREWIKILILVLMVYSFSLLILAQEENTKESAAAIIKKVLMESGGEAAKMKFKEMLIGEGGKYYFNEQEFIDLGNLLRSSGKVKASITAFKMTIEFVPKSSNAWFNLGQAYVRDVNEEKAIECYKKALELNSKNSMAEEELGWIELRINDARLETREIERFEPAP